MPDSSQVFSSNLRVLFERSGWSQREFGAKIGISQPQVGEYLKGRSTPPFDMLNKISAIFGVSVADLFHTDTPPRPAIERPTISDDLRAETAKIARQAAIEAANEIRLQVLGEFTGKAFSERLKSLPERISAARESGTYPEDIPAVKQLLEANSQALAHIEQQAAEIERLQTRIKEFEGAAPKSASLPAELSAVVATFSTLNDNERRSFLNIARDLLARMIETRPANAVDQKKAVK